MESNHVDVQTCIPAVAECLCSSTQTGQAAQALMHVRTESVRQSLVSRQLGCKHARVILASISSSTIGYFGTATVYHKTVTVRTGRGEVPVDAGIFVMVSVIKGRVCERERESVSESVSG
jgi:hypothetical protein